MVGSRRTLKVCVATLENVGDKEGFSAATAEDLLGEVLDGGLPGFSSSAINSSSVMSMGSSFAKINRSPLSFASINNWNWAPSLSSNRSSRYLITNALVENSDDESTTCAAGRSLACV